MRKYLFIIAATLGAAAATAQDIKDVRTFALTGQLAKAKEAVDKHLEVPKNAQKAEGWYYKGYIYNLVSKDSSKPAAENAALKATAFEALKKYRELDPKAELLTEQNNSTLFDLYVGYYSDLGVKAYLAKDPATAVEYFKKALEVHDYVATAGLTGNNGYKFSPLDTTLVLYTAIASNEAKKPDDAVVFYRKLVDANIAEKDYIDAYQFLADYYKTKKDKAAFAEIIEKGKKAYPANNEYWSALEIEEATEGIEKPGLFTKYEELMVKNPTNYTLPYNYAVELYRYIYSDEMKDSVTTTYKEKLPEILKKAIALKSTSEANFLMANFLYNNSIDLSEEARKVKGTKPDDVKKKKQLQTQSDEALNQSVPYAEAVVASFKAIEKPKTSEKINYKQALSILKSVSEVKKETAKVAEYDKLMKEAQ